MITAKKMREVTESQLVELFVELGLQAGDRALVHSALQFLGRPAQGAHTYLRAICRVLNIPLPSQSLAMEPQLPEGCLVVPAFNFAFARGETYDPLLTPSCGMGVFSELVRQLPEASRTPHPLQSLAVIGCDASDLSGRDTSSAFDSGSAFERLLELDYSVLLLGADIQSVSLLHYSELHQQVPYRYWKTFPGKVVRDGKVRPHTYRMYVRDLDLDPRLDIHAIQDLLQTRGQWRQLALNYGQVALFRARDFVAAADELLEDDPWVFVTNRPESASRAKPA
jgi:aminoglycoside N3'-acetyltransferase